MYGEDLMVPLRTIWAVLDAPTGKRLAPFLVEIVAALQRCDELDLDPGVRAKLVAMSAATIDRRLAAGSQEDAAPKAAVKVCGVVAAMLPG